MENFAHRWLKSVSPEKENTSYRKITLPMCNLSGYKHSWTFFLPFSSQMRLNLSVMVLTIHGIPTLGPMEIYTRWHNVIFSAVFL
jgi:hypothetical protein